MIPAGPAVSERLDPRIRRTRQLLQAALQQLLETKTFADITVAEIAGAATLNRATFYDHYPDKIALLEDLVRTRFLALLERRQVDFSAGCDAAVMGIIGAMCDYLTSLPGTECETHRRLENHFESALRNVLRRLMLDGIRGGGHSLAIAPELVAATMSGAIYGGVSEWVQMPDRVPAEQVVLDIFRLIHPMLA